MEFSLLSDEFLKELENKEIKPKLLLHSCCAPCSSYVLEFLSSYFEISVYYYNPNIYPPEEFHKRLQEQEKYSSIFAGKNVEVVGAEYDENEFYTAVKGLEKEPEGGVRCRECFYLRFLKTAEYAKNHGFDYFTSTLSISPHKNAKVLNEVGNEVSEKTGIKYLYSDFKKKNGYLRSCELSKEHGIYRQDYCGCIFSKNEAEMRRKNKEKQS